MVLTSDYHTHTVFSHGKGNIIDNAVAAKNIGLKEVGISDHGFAHPAFGLTKRKLPVMRKLCDEATEKTGVKILLGIESNIIGNDGTCDLKERYYDCFDIFLAGVHKFVMYKFKSIFTLSIPNLYRTYIAKNSIPERLIKENTKTFINVIEKNPVDIITHVNFCCFCDTVEVAKAARDYGTYIELNSKKRHFTDDELYKISKTGVSFVIDSDAHTPDRVGEISLVEKELARVDIDLNKIANIDGRVPDFRFKKYKESAGK